MIDLNTITKEEYQKQIQISGVVPNQQYEINQFLFNKIDELKLDISKLKSNINTNSVIKTFILPDDKYHLEVNNQAENMYFAITEFKEWLRSQIKYNDREDLEFVRDAFNDILNEHNFIEVSE